MNRINELKGKCKEFAAACYEENSMEELSLPHTPSDADEADMREWKITAQEWSNAIEAALQDLQCRRENENETNS
jgi:hypothetical protein